jgi:hypothetical protein
MKRLQHYLSITQLLHMLLLAFGGGLMTEIFSPQMDKVILVVLITGLFASFARLMYSKTYSGTAKKRHRQ